MAGIVGVNSGDSKNVSFLGNVSGQEVEPLYIFLPVGYTTKLAFLISAMILGVVGFAGGSLIMYFVSSRKQALYLRSNRFMKNLNFYIKSLALSDMLCALVTLPLNCIQIYFDIFQSRWACKIVRYLSILFPVITINNLVVIGVEKYFSLRRVPRTLRASTVRKLIFLAWAIGFAISLFPAATFATIRYDLNETHFTVVCKYDREYLPFQVMFQSFIVVAYVLPSIFLIVVNITLIRRVWIKVRMTVSIQVNNPIRARLRAAKIRGTLLLVTVTFAFVIPYFAYLGYVTYNTIAKPDIDFKTDFVIRYASAVLAFSNCAINFVIYVVQMKDFRVFLRNLICGSSSVEQPAENNPS
ncbi:pyroglutamylated RF-amide peptide receptor-like [Oculina patagonica]